MGNLVVLIIGIVIYLLTMVLIGFLAQRNTTSEVEDYYLAKRGLNNVVLFCSILGTNMSAFVMLGVAGLVYRGGAGIYSLIFGGAILTYSILPWIWGNRSRILGKKFGYITPTEYLEERFKSPVISVIAFLVFAIYTLPYVTIGEIGAGTAIAKYTNGTVPYWLGALIVALIVAYYVSSGGMKGTAWTNVIQVGIFLVFLIVGLFWIGIKAGGAHHIFEQVKNMNPSFLDRSNQHIYTWKKVFSQFALYSITIYAQPQIYVRFLAAKSGKSMRRISLLFPLGILFTWIPAVLIGFWGIALVPGLKGNASDNILFILSDQFLPVWMFAFAIIALLAIAMSSMDAQTLTLSSLFTNDIMKTRFKMSAKKTVKWGRLFVLFILAVSYLFALAKPASVFLITEAAFTGFASLVPVMVGGIYWRRLNKPGAMASVIVSAILVPLYFAHIFLPGSSVAQSIDSILPTFGFDPIVPILAITLVVMVVVTLLTKKQENSVADEQFAYLAKVYGTNKQKHLVVKKNQEELTD